MDCDGGLRFLPSTEWTEWLPTYAWVIDTDEGIIVVDTGQGAHLLEIRQVASPFRAVGGRHSASSMNRRSVRSCARSASGRAM